MTAAPLWLPRTPPPSLDRLARRPLLRRFTALRMVLRATDNLLEMFHPDVYDRPWDVTDLGVARVVTVADPDAAKRILVDNAANYEKGPLYEALLGDFIGEGSLLMRNEPARIRRRMLVPALNARALRRLEGVVERHVDALFARWRDAGPEFEIDLTREAPALALAVAMEAFFSDSLGEDYRPLSAFLEEVMTLAGTPSAADVMALPKWAPRKSRRRVRELVAELDALLEPIIDRRIARRGEGLPGAPDMLDLLVHATDPETGEPLARADVRNETMTLFMAGHETTALSLAWGLDRLAREPAAQARLADAAREAAARGPIGCAEARAMPAVTRAYDEMLRLYPPAYTVSRTALAADRCGDLEIRAGDRVQIAIFMMHRAPRLWRDPARFDPDRFAEKDRHPHAFMPFGAGPRNCVGSGVARMEAHLLLARLAADYRLDPVGPPPSAVGKVTLRPAAPIRLRLARRAETAAAPAAATAEPA